MIQALAIFRKDARRSRVYIAIVAALTALLAILTPLHTNVYNQQTRSLNTAIDLLQMLILPLTWWLAVSHAFHAEPLPGDRQFWTTRPYSWRSLLAAKLLFCAAFILLPFLVSDCYIVAAMGFSPVALFPVLLGRAFLVAALYLVPAALVAAVTRSTRQFLLSGVALAVAVIVLLPIAVRHPGHYVFNALSGQESPSHWGFALWCAVTIALLPCIYAFRRIAAARMILIAGAAIALVSATTPSKAIAPAPPKPDRHPEIVVAVAPPRHSGEIHPTIRNKVQLHIPLEFSGRDRDLLDWAVASVTVTGAGPAVTLPWNFNLAYARNDAIEFFLDPPDFDRLSRASVRIDLVLGVTVYDFVRRVSLPPNTAWTEVPGVGLARLVHTLPWTGVEWRTPIRYPAEKLIYRFQDAQTARSDFERSSMGHPDQQLFHVSPVATWTSPLGNPRITTLGSVEIVVARQIDFLRRDLSIPAASLSDWTVPH